MTRYLYIRAEVPHDKEKDIKFSRTFLGAESEDDAYINGFDLCGPAPDGFYANDLVVNVTEEQP